MDRLLPSLKDRRLKVCLHIKILALICCTNYTFAQTNLVPNPSFEELTDCDFGYGAADYAAPWKIIDEEISSPDLFHSCALNTFYQIPIGTPSQPIYPHSGDGMVGLVNLVTWAEERIYARLLEALPTDVDIYVAFSTMPRAKSGTEMGYLCYSNTQSMAFSDIVFESRIVVLESETVIDNTEEWTTLQTCYQATGQEKLVLLGNYKLTSETLMDCDNIDPQQNFAYFFVDDVIVAPFDVVPDTLFICGDEVLDFDIEFYDLPIQWDDGWAGGVRTIDEGGLYEVMGEAGNCFLKDEVLVIKVPDEMETINIELCIDDEILLETPFLSEWNNGEHSAALLVTRPGVYTAKMLSPCGERLREFVVEEKACNIRYFVPNIFSPNDDGINDRMEFFFQAEFEFSGELNIFDRWGNLLFRAKNDSSSFPLSWDGTFKGQRLDPGVFVWAYRYTTGANNKTQVISGDFTLVR